MTQLASLLAKQDDQGLGSPPLTGGAPAPVCLPAIPFPGAPAQAAAALYRSLTHTPCRIPCASGLPLQVEQTTLEQLGTARKVTVANSTTTLIADQVCHSTSPLTTSARH